MKSGHGRATGTGGMSNEARKSRPTQRLALRKAHGEPLLFRKVCRFPSLMKHETHPPHAAMVRTASGRMSSASVAAWTSSTVRPGATSSSTKPSGVTEITAMSV